MTCSSLWCLLRMILSTVLSASHVLHRTLFPLVLNTSDRERSVDKMQFLTGKVIFIGSMWKVIFEQTT